MGGTVVEDIGKAGTPHPDTQHALMTIGIAPVIFSGEYGRIGRLDSEKHRPIKELREKHRKTHAFRFDARDGPIANIGLRSGIEPMGKIEEARVGANLLLLAEAIEHKLRQWLSGRRKILRRFRPLICLGDRDRLLDKALKEVGIQKPDKRIDVVAKWSFELRLLTSADPEQQPWLGLLADVGTSNVIDVPVSELLEQGFDPIGYYVGTPGEIDDISGSSRVRLLGRVTGVEEGVLVLDDVRDDANNERVNAADVLLEPRRETLEAIVQKLHPAVAANALDKLRCIRAPYLSGDRKLEKIRRMVASLNESLGKTSGKASSLTFGDGLIGKFRLTNVRFHFAEISGDTGESYEAAAKRAREELPQTPALALVQVRSAHRQRVSSQNPYFVAKSRFMRASVPVQAVRLETVLGSFQYVVWRPMNW